MHRCTIYILLWVLPIILSPAGFLTSGFIRAYTLNSCEHLRFCSHVMWEYGGKLLVGRPEFNNAPLCRDGGAASASSAEQTFSQTKKPFLHVVPFLFSIQCSFDMCSHLSSWNSDIILHDLPCYRYKLMCKKRREKKRRCNTNKCWLKIEMPFYTFQIIIKKTEKQRRWWKRILDVLEKFKFRNLNRKWRSGHLRWCWNGQIFVLEVLPNEGKHFIIHPQAVSERLHHLATCATQQPLPNQLGLQIHINVTARTQSLRS